MTSSTATTNGRAKKADVGDVLETAHDVEAEKSLLGSLLLDSAKFSDVQGIVQTADFWDPPNRIVARAIWAMHRAGVPIDRVTLWSDLKGTAAADKIGGIAYITELAEAVPHARHAAYYAGIVAQRAYQRNVRTAGESLIQHSADDHLATTDPDAFRAKAVGMVELIANNKIVGDTKPVEVIRLSEVEAEVVRWAWRGRIPLGKLTMLMGDPGKGKSTAALNITACTTRGWPMPGETQASVPRGSVVLLSAEDGLADTIRPRLDAAGADCTRVVALKAIMSHDENGDYRRPLDLARDIERIEAAVGEVQDCRLVVIDPVSAYMGEDTDSHENAAVRRVLAPVAEMAERLGVAVLAITHMRKAEGKAMYRAMGSLAFIAAARSALAVCEDPEDPGKRLLLPVKSNLSAPPEGLAFRIIPRDDVATIEWLAGAVTMTVDEALATRPRRGPGAGRVDEAAAWLQAELADGKRHAAEISAVAVKAGISAATLQRAKAVVGVRSVKDGLGVWAWELPREDAQTHDSLP